MGRTLTITAIAGATGYLLGSTRQAEPPVPTGNPPDGGDDGVELLGLLGPFEVETLLGVVGDVEIEEFLDGELGVS